MIKINNLNLYDPSLLDEEMHISHPMGDIVDFQLPLTKYMFLSTYTRSTHQKKHTS